MSFTYFYVITYLDARKGKKVQKKTDNRTMNHEYRESERIFRFFRKILAKKGEDML